MSTPRFRHTKKSPPTEADVAGLDALAAHASTVASKDLRVTGVDYDMKYVAAARRRCEGDARLAKRVHVRCLSIYDDQLLATLRPAGGFDASYFSGSLSLMPDPPAALRAAAAVTKPGGYIYVTQTFQRRPVPLLAPEARRSLDELSETAARYHDLRKLVKLIQTEADGLM